MVKLNLLNIAVVFLLLTQIKGYVKLEEGQRCYYMWHQTCESGYCKFNTLKHVELNLLAAHVVEYLDLYGICAAIEERPSFGNAGADIYNVKGTKLNGEKCDHQSECDSDFCQYSIVSETENLSKEEKTKYGFDENNDFHSFCTDEDSNRQIPNKTSKNLRYIQSLEIEVVRGNVKTGDTCVSDSDCQIGYCVDIGTVAKDYEEKLVCSDRPLNLITNGGTCKQSYQDKCESRYCKIDTDEYIYANELGDVQTQQGFLKGKCAGWEDRPWKHLGEELEMKGWREFGQACARNYDRECISGKCSLDIEGWKKMVLLENGKIRAGGLALHPVSTCSDEKKPYYMDSISKIINKDIL